MTRPSPSRSVNTVLGIKFPFSAGFLQELDAVQLEWLPKIWKNGTGHDSVCSMPVYGFRQNRSVREHLWCRREMGFREASFPLPISTRICDGWRSLRHLPPQKLLYIAQRPCLWSHTTLGYTNPAAQRAGMPMRWDRSRPSLICKVNNRVDSALCTKIRFTPPLPSITHRLQECFRCKIAQFHCIFWMAFEFLYFTQYCYLNSK